MDVHLCTSNFVINNLPAEQRQFLSRKSVQDEICKFADVKIYTRGHYIKPRHDGSVENGAPLSLRIVGATKRNVDIATEKINSLLMKTHEFEEKEMSDTEKITIGIDIFPSIFRMKTKVLGDNNENVEYILNETGAVMTLRGKGSGFIDLKEKKESDDPLHVHVRYKNLDNKERARELILNLIDTVQQDFNASTYGKYYSPPKKPEIIPVPLDKIRRTSSYNSIPSRSPVRSIDRPGDRRSAETRGSDARYPLESRPYDSRTSEPRPYEKRSSLEPRPYDNRTSEPRPYESRSSESRHYDNRHPEPRPFESRTSEPRPYESRPFESRAPEPKSYNDRPFESRPFDSRAPEPKSYSDRPSESRPFDSRAPEPKSYSDRPSESRPFDSRAPEPKSYSDRPSESRQFDSRAPESKSYSDRPSESRPLDTRAPESKSYSDRPSESRPLDSRAPEPKPYSDRPSESRPFDSRAPEPKPYNDRSSESRPFDSRAPEPKPYNDRPPESRPFESRPSEKSVFDSRPSRPSESSVFDSRPSRPSEPSVLDSRPSRPSESSVFDSRPSRPSESSVFDSRPVELKPFEKRTRESRFESLPADPKPFENHSSDGRSVEKPLPDSTKASPSENISSNIEKITIGIESVPVAFNLKSKIYGPNLANVKHIEKVASALLLVEGKGCGVNSSGEESQEPPYILVKYLKPDLKEVARNLIFNLIETIQQEYIQLYGRYPGGPQKPQIVPIKKLVNDKTSAEPIKPKNPSPDITPVPPPPPVISKNSSPDRFDNVPPPVNFGLSITKPLSPKLFANAEPTPVPRPVQPVIPSTTNVYEPPPFLRLPDPDPIPVAPSFLGSQSSILNSVLSPQTRLLQPGSFGTSETSQAQIQTIQYSEKRPKSPIESVAADAKRFCSTGVGTFNSTIPSTVPTAVVQQRPTIAAPKGKNPFQRNLIPVNVSKQITPPAVGSSGKAPAVKPVPPPVPMSISTSSPSKPGILKKPRWNNARNGGKTKHSDSDEEGVVSNPIILSDSEDEGLNSHRNNLRISATISKNSGRDISVQTDDKLYRTQIKNIKCACGRFMHVVTGVRSVETQTIGGDSFRRF